MFRYRATKTGVLNNPFRYVKAGEVVESKHEISASWLVDEKKFMPAPALPVSGHMVLAGTQVQQVLTPPVVSTKGYTDQMEQLKKLEAIQDAKNVEPAPALPVTEEEHVDEVEETSGEQVQPLGTGDQDVL